MREKWVKLMLLAPLVLLGLVLFIALGGVIVHQLWNWLLPALFGWPQISFWQALGLLVLCRILFGGFGPHGSARSNVRRRISDRWERLTPEERDRFRQGMRDRWGFGTAAGESKEQ